MALGEVDQQFEATTGQPPPTRDIYADAVTEMLGTRESMVRTNVKQGAETPPDTTAEAARLSDSLGVPLDVVARNLDTARKQAQAKDLPADQIVAQSPHLAEWLGQSPAHASVVQDDLHQLGLLEWLTTGPERAFKSARSQQAYAELRIREMYGQTLSPEEQKQKAALQASATQDANFDVGNSWFRGALTGFGSFAGNQVAPLQAAAAGALTLGAAGAAAGTVLPGAGTLAGGFGGAVAGAAAGGLFGVTHSTFQQETVGAYDEFVNFKDELGRPIDPSVARAAALVVGGLNAFIEAGVTSYVVSKIPGIDRLSPAGIRLTVKAALRVPTVRAALGHAMLTYGKTMTAEVAQEASQNLIKIMFGEAAKTVSNVTGQRGTAPAANAAPTEPTLRSASGPSDQGFAAIRQREGFSPTPYEDAGGPAIGYGMHTYHGQPVTMQTPPITQQDADAELATQAQATYGPVITQALAGTPVTQGQYDALLSVTWNSPAAGKKLAERLHAGETLTEADFKASGTVQGKPVAALQERRAAEFAQFGAAETAAPTAAQPSGTSPDFTHRTLSDIVSEVGQTITGAAQSFALGVAFGPLAEAGIGIRQARQAKAASALFTQIGEGVKDSKTFKRAPAAVEALVQRAADAGPAPNVYIPTEAWAQYWQDQGQDPAAVAKEVTGRADALEEAQRTGTDLRIPTGRYATTLAPTEHNAYFANELRLTPEEMNGREADAALEAQQAQQEAQAEAAKPAATRQQEADDQVHQAIVDELQRAGFLPQQAEAQAQLIRQGVGRMAADAGIGYAEALSPYGLQVQRPTAQEAAGGAKTRIGVGAPTVPSSPAVRQPGLTGTAPEAQTAPSGAGPASPSVNRPGSDALVRVAESRPAAAENEPLRRRAGESDRALASRRRDAVRTAEQTRTQAHYDTLFTYVAAHAQQIDPNVDLADLRQQFDTRLSQYEEHLGYYRESGHDPTDLLRTIASAGGINTRDTVFPGEVRNLMEGSQFGKVRGHLVFTKDGQSLDDMLTSLRQDQRFQWIDTPTELVDAIDEAIRHEPLHAEGVLPGSDQLPQDLGINVASQWWAPSTAPQEATTDAVDTGGDTSFNPSEFSQSLFGPLKEAAQTPKPAGEVASATGVQPALVRAGAEGPAPRLAGFTNSGNGIGYLQFDLRNGPDVTVADVKAMFPGLPITVSRFASNHVRPDIRRFRIDADRYDRAVIKQIEEQVGSFTDWNAPVVPSAGQPLTEAQPVLPGTEAVRETENATPQLEAPFALTPTTAKAERQRAAEAPPSEQYLAAKAEADLVGARFREATRAYRAKEISDAEYLAVRAENTAAQADFDRAFEREQALGRSTTTLFQPEGRRGSIQIGPGRKMTINLFEQADLSTFLHESGHFFLEVFGDLANKVARIAPDQRTEGQQRLLGNWQAAQEWLADEDHTGPGFSTKQHEQFATAFERYLFEAKAPSEAVRSIFAQFRKWLLGVYQAMGPAAKLTPEVRAIFDRMLASDQEIAAAEARGQMVPLFTTAEQAKMTDEQFALYRTTLERAHETAVADLDAKLAKDIARTHQAEWKARRAEIHTDVEQDYYNRPVYQALAAIRRGLKPDGSPLVEGMAPQPMQLSKQAILAGYGPDALAQLPAFTYINDGGLLPEQVATLFGYETGDALLTALSDAPPMRASIERDTDQRMIAEHGSLLFSAELPAEAQASVASETQEAVIRQELRALWALKRTVAPFERQAAAVEGQRTAEANIRTGAVTDELRAQQQAQRGGPATIRAAVPSAQTVRVVAQERVAATRIRDLEPRLHWAAMTRASKLAVEAAARGDYDAAIHQSTLRLLNLGLYRETEKAKSDVESRVQVLRGYLNPGIQAKVGKAGGGFLEQLNALLARYDLAHLSNKAIDVRTKMKDWLPAMSREGMAVDLLPTSVTDDERQINYRELPYESFVGLSDGAQMLVHLAQQRNKFNTAQLKGEFIERRDNIVNGILEHNAIKKLPLTYSNPKESRGLAVSRWFASHTRLSELIREVDGIKEGGRFEPVGPLHAAIVRPLSDAQDLEHERKLTAFDAIGKILDAAYPGRELVRLKRETTIEGVGTLSLENRLMVALTAGNRHGMDRLVDDQSRHLSRPQIQQVLETLDATDKAVVESIWKYVNSYWSDIVEHERRLTGIVPEKVEAVPFETHLGEWTGGYSPLMYDVRLAPSPANAAASDAHLATAAAYAQRTTAQGHLQTRREHLDSPVRLDLGVIYQHVEQVIHDLTHRAPLLDATRLIRDRKLARAIYDTKGSAFYDEITGALQDIAIGHKADQRDKIATFVRTGSQIYALGFNLWTGVQQPLGVFNGMSEVGPTWVAKGVGKWMRDSAAMDNTVRAITDKSNFMRHRFETGTQDLADLHQNLGKVGGWFDTAVRTVSADKLTQTQLLHGFLWHIGMMQRVADVPTWLGAYEKGREALHLTDEDAVAYADQKVVDSQGGGRLIDLSAQQRGGPVAKLFLTFYSYGATIFNSSRNRIAATDFMQPSEVLTLLGHFSLLYVMPAFMTIAMAKAFGKRNPEDPEDWLRDTAAETLSTALNSMIYVREIAGAVETALGLPAQSRGYEGPAGTRLLTEIYNLAGQIHQGKLDQGLLNAANQVTGILAKYPGLQIQRSVEGFMALEEGKTHNPAALLFGYQAKVPK